MSIEVKSFTVDVGSFLESGDLSMKHTVVIPFGHEMLMHADYLSRRRAIRLWYVCDTDIPVSMNRETTIVRTRFGDDEFFEDETFVIPDMKEDDAKQFLACLIVGEDQFFLFDRLV